MRHIAIIAAAVAALAAPVLLHPAAAESPASQPAQTYPALQKRLAELKAENEKLTSDIEKLKSDRDWLRTKVSQLEEEASKRQQADKNAKSVAAGGADERSDEIRIGMSLKAMQTFCAGEGTLEGKGVGGSRYTFYKANSNGFGGMYYFCLFDAKGKLASYTQESHAPSITLPH